MGWTINPDRKQNRATVLLLLFIGGVLLLILCLMMSLKIGPAAIGWRTIFDAVFKPGGASKEELYIRTLRLPRTVVSALVGAQLALAGLLTQLATKNPLASPHVFGINAGASLAVVSGLLFLPAAGLLSSVGLAFTGAVLGALVIWFLAGSGPKLYVTLALAGISVHFLFASLTEGAMILASYSTESMISWLVGSVNHASWQDVRLLAPLLGGGLALLLCLLPALRLLELDDEVAVGLGSRLYAIRALSMLLVVLFAGSAVAICGPIGFVCLIVPHIARALLGRGSSLNVVVPFTALLGSVLLLAADVLSRWIAFPFESPVGIVTALVGAPAFLYLARRQGGKTR
ncbi:iron ABC transporter permease [Cohnella sp. F6_2S_P_1]|uniref:Iron ABC transporter permease n=2 Tax=Cohnella hashimotonis TaxID=2826895 RepID=A0ABT6TSD2_9BACL|nr:iron ABC transporter permease [Cohnella hashimotonis]MDI4649700.1 iron ABC transporter permease [Cohnella hashimotonis]